MSTTHLLSLPIEIRLEIYRLIVPHHRRIQFNEPTQRSWNGLPKRPAPPIGIPTNLFLINHLISEEARYVLYAENEFTYEINSHTRNYAPKLRAPGLGLLRQLCRLELTVKLSYADYECARRHRNRLQSFAKTLAEQGSRGKPALRHLKIKFDPSVSVIRGCRFLGYQQVKGLRWQYVLEELTPLRPVENVEVEGVDDWLARCLEKAIMGTGGEVQEIDYPEIECKRRKRGGFRKMPTSISTRSWYMPRYNWEEFAKRNGIAISKDVIMTDT